MFRLELVDTEAFPLQLRSVHAYNPSRCILAERKLCRMKTKGFGQPSMSSSCQNRNS